MNSGNKKKAFIFEVGGRVYTKRGFQNHGPMEGPRVNVRAELHGTVDTITTRFGSTLIHVVWDDTVRSAHYLTEAVLALTPFSEISQVEKCFAETLQCCLLTVGPQGGFKDFRGTFVYDGKHFEIPTEVINRSLWSDIVEPLLKKHALEYEIARLPSTRKRAD